MRYIRLFLQTVGVLVGIAAVVFGGFVAWGINKSAHAKEESEAFCAEYPIGAPVADMIAAAPKRLAVHTEDEQAHVHEFIFADTGMSLMKCVVTERRGKIVAKNTVAEED